MSTDSGEQARDDRCDIAGEAAGAVILVVDDDPDFREALAALLREEGYQVVCESTGRGALAYLCGNPAPALVFADVLLPGLNAWELIAEMRRRERLTRVPVILVTGLSRHLIAPPPQEMLLQKPIDPSELLEHVRAALTPSAHVFAVSLPGRHNG